MPLGQLSSLPIENIYHVCAVVKDLAQSMAGIGARLGVEAWTQPVASTRAYRRGADGVIVTTRISAVFSRQGPPHLELIEAHDEPHTLWPSSPGPRLDHIGVHVADAAAEARRLVAGGMILEAEFVDLPADHGEPVSRQVYYLRDPLGFRTEIVDASRRPYLQAWLDGETYPAP